MDIKKAGYLYTTGLLSVIFLLILLSIIFFWGTQQKELIGKDEDVFKQIPQYLGENINFFKIQPHNPLASSSFILTHKLFSSLSFQYTFNWLIHTLNTLLLFLFCAFIYQTNRNITTLIISFLLSCLFLIHPLNIYSTSFLINRGGLLSSFFALLLLTILLRYSHNTSLRIFPIVLMILLVILSTFSHFIGIISLVFLFYIYYTYKQERSNTIILYGCGIFGLLLTLFILLSLYQHIHNTDIYASFPPFKYFNIISGFIILFFFPTAFFPLQYFEVNSLLNIPITCAIILMLFIIGFYFYKNSQFFPVLSSLFVLLGIIIYPLFQRLDLSMCNSSYFLIVSIILLLFVITHHISQKSNFVSAFIVIFLLILLGALSIFSFQLTYELRDPERLWLACVGNYPSNPEAWKYLARTLTKKSKTTTPQKNIYLDKAEQAWDNLLTLQPENTEALREKSILCLEKGQYEDARKYIARCLGLNPFDKENIRTQIHILENGIQQQNNEEMNWWEIYNSYIHLYLINKKLSDEEKSKFLQIACKLSNYEQASDILKLNIDTLHNLPETDEFQKGYEEIQKALKNVPATLLNTGDTFKAPYLAIADYYDKKRLFSLSQAWLSCGISKEPNNKDLFVKLGVLSGKMGKSEEFIKRWGNYFTNDDTLWEKVAEECISNKDFASAQNYIEPTHYSISKKYIILSNMAIEKGYQEQAQLWIEQAQNNNPSTEELQEINELLKKLHKP